MSTQRQNRWVRPILHVLVALCTVLACFALLSLLRLHSARLSATPVLAASLPPAANEPSATQPDLLQYPPAWLEVTADPTQAWPGELVTFTVRVHAEADLSEGLLSAALPAGLAFEAVQGEGAYYVAEQRTVYWPLPQVRMGSTLELRFQVRITEDAPDLMVQRVELRAPGFSSAAVGQTVVKRLFPPTEAVITPAGGELRSADGRVQVCFPAGAVSQSVRIQHIPRQVDRLPARRAGLALQFELNAVTDDATATPVHGFAQPLELRVDLHGLVDWDAMPYWQYAFLAYRDEQGQWIELPTRRQGDILLASLEHLSAFGGGTGNVYDSGWLLAFNDAHVATFSGGLSYDYPIQVPTGRGGLTPDLRLSYNSRRIDGILT